MNLSAVRSQTTLQVLLYGGIALIVVSMLFLGQTMTTSTFLAQAGFLLAPATFFYGAGALVCRYLKAPLAGPGIVATGAWLVGVDLIHLEGSRALLPAAIEPYYWLVASLFAVALLTVTGHRVRTWLVVPLVPISQVNALATVMAIVGLPVAWWSVAAFGLVLAWWEFGPRDERWTAIYRVSAVLLAGFLLFFSNWLEAPGSGPTTIVATWLAGAGVVAWLGLRYGWTNAGPLVIVMLAYASAWALPPTLWPIAWVMLAFVTILFIERQMVGERQMLDPARSKSLAIEISVAVAVLLSSIAALYVKTALFAGVVIPPPVAILVLFVAGVAIAWLGWRREMGIAAHLGLWLMASAWAEVYVFLFQDGGAYGFWLALLAAVALLVERFLTTVRGHVKKRKQVTVTETVMRWPLADLSIGLSIIIVIWAVLNVLAVDILLITLTLFMVIGVWLAAGLVYRLPILLHVALWMAPLPYALTLLLVAPPLRTLPLIGFAWQVLGLVYLLLGHAMSHHRPPLLWPFFIAGYCLLGCGITLTIGMPALFLVSLGLVMLVCLGSSVAVIANLHPAWTALVARFISPEQRPYAFHNVHNSFLVLGAWITSIWLYLMLASTALTFSQQGIVLVLFSSAWILLGRLLARLPRAIGWPVYGAGWFMWCIGLLHVFFAPTEALITIILGLAISVEALCRTREVYWMPVLVLQLLFTALQIAWLLSLSGQMVLLAVLTAITVAGMWYECSSRQAGRLTAYTGVVVLAVIWLSRPDFVSSFWLSLVFISVALRYRNWQYLLPVYGLWTAWGLIAHFNVAPFWQHLFVGGLAQILAGVTLIRRGLVPRCRTLEQLLFRQSNGGTFLLWSGGISTGIALVAATQTGPVLAVLPTPFLLLAITVTVSVMVLNVRGLHTIATGLWAVVYFMVVAGLYTQPYVTQKLAVLNIATAFVTLTIQAVSRYLVVFRRPGWVLRRLAWWIRPLLVVSVLLLLFNLISHLALLLYTQWLEVIGYPALLLNGLLLMAVIVVILWHRRRGDLLLLLVGLWWLNWALVLDGLGLSGILWHAIPLGMVCIALSRVLYLPNTRSLEALAVVVPVVGLVLEGNVSGSVFVPLTTAGLYLDGFALVSLASVGLYLVGVMVYGALAGRRLPFACPLVMIGGGLAWQVVTINFWLAPLAVGLLAIGAVLLLEINPGMVEQRLARWVRQWQQWD